MHGSAARAGAPARRASRGRSAPARSAARARRASCCSASARSARSRSEASSSRRARTYMPGGRGRRQQAMLSSESQSDVRSSGRSPPAGVADRERRQPGARPTARRNAGASRPREGDQPAGAASCEHGDGQDRQRRRRPAIAADPQRAAGRVPPDVPSAAAQPGRSSIRPWLLKSTAPATRAKAKNARSMSRLRRGTLSASVRAGRASTRLRTIGLDLGLPASPVGRCRGPAARPARSRA